MLIIAALIMKIIETMQKHIDCHFYVNLQTELAGRGVKIFITAAFMHAFTLTQSMQIQ